MIKYFTALFFAIILLSCSQKDLATKYSFSEKQITAKKYYYTLTTSSVIKANTNQKNIETKKTAIVEFMYQLERDTLGNRVVTLTYDKFHITIKKDDGEEDVYDSEKEGDSSPMIDRVLAKIKGSSIKITADSYGKVISTVGVKEITEKITEALPAFEDDQNESIKKHLEEFIGEKFIKNNVIENLSLIPDSALAIGSSWSQKTNLDGDIPMEATITYNLDNVENGIGVIHSNSEFVTTADKPISILGMMANADLNGKITGDYKALEKSGFLISAETILKINGTLNVSNQEIPVSIYIKKTLKAVEVNK